MKYHLITYGCQMNTADSEEMAKPLKARGLVPTSDLRKADIILMNTCTVREQAEHRADSNLGRLQKWKAADPRRILIVAGCAASRWGDSIRKRYPYIDAVSPATRIDQFPALIEKVLKERWNFEEENREAFSEPTAPSPAPSTAPRNPANEGVAENGRGALFGDERTAYITIMRGCNYACSYCIVPQVRGREVYRPLDQILEEVRQKAAEGFEEVMLLGQTVNSYRFRGPEETADFADLLRAVQAVPGVERIRFMSPHPRHMRPGVIQAMKESPKVCRHIHLPVQSGSDRLLARMKRLYTRQDYLSIADQLRAAMPGLWITTDVIVGYPGETEEDFQDTLLLLEQAAVDGAFVFKFSARPGTEAATATDGVPAEVEEERLQRALALARRLSRKRSPWSN